MVKRIHFGTTLPSRMIIELKSAAKRNNIHVSTILEELWRNNKHEYQKKDETNKSTSEHPIDANSQE